MASFQYLNFNFTDAGAATQNVAYSAPTQPLTPTISGANGFDSFVFFGTATVNTGSAAVLASATDVTNGNPGILFTKTNHGLFTGLVGQFTTSNALPTGISLATNYYVIKVTDNTFKVATSLANALNNTAVAYTNTGTGNQTFTPTAIAGASLKLQGSFDGVNWVDVSNTSTNITVTAAIGPLIVDYVRYPQYRAYCTISSGSINFSPLQIGYRGGA